MSEFLTQSLLAERLVQKTSVSYDVARSFSSVFFAIVRKGLKNANTFSVYSFGTFKKTWTETTMGINPSTGAKIEIPAHWRIKFVPCTAVAKRINKKYANLKPRAVRHAKNQKVGPDGLYARASKLEEDSKAATVISPFAEPGSEKNTADEKSNFSTGTESKNLPEENTGLLRAAEEFRAEQAVREAENPESDAYEKNKNIPEHKMDRDEIYDVEDGESFDDDFDEQEEKRRPWLFIVLGTAAVILVLLISLLLKNCSPKNRRQNDEKLGDSSAETSGKKNDAEPRNESNTDAGSPYDEIAADELFESYLVPIGGCYNKIAAEKYRNRHLWPLIYSANKSSNPDPDLIGASYSLKIPEIPKDEKIRNARINQSMLDAYNGYLLMCEKQPENPKNAKRRNLAARVIVSAEIVLPGFIEKNRDRILPEYAEMAANILKNQYRN